REASWSSVSAVPRDATAKLAIRQETQQLRKHRPALVHEPLSAAAEPALGARRRSNRGKAKRVASHWRSKLYRNSQSTLPDTSGSIQQPDDSASTFKKHWVVWPDAVTLTIPCPDAV